MDMLVEVKHKMTRAPDFSIILPTYNREHLLPRAIKSVLCQTFKNYELIIVDDASTDSTPKAVHQFSDPRIRYYYHTKNKGVAAARNYGICLAKGRFISFLDDDDQYLPAFLEKTLQELTCAPQSVGFSWAGQFFVEDTLDGEKLISKKHWFPKPHLPQDRIKLFLQTMNIGTGWGITIKHHCFKHTGLFDESFKVGEDTEFILRLCESFEGIPITKYLVKVHSHSGPNLFYSKVQTAEILDKMLQKHYNKFRHDLKLLTYFKYKVGWRYYFANNRQHGRKYLLEALNANPLNIKKWIIFIYLELFGADGIAFQRQLSSRINSVFDFNSNEKTEQT